VKDYSKVSKCEISLKNDKRWLEENGVGSKGTRTANFMAVAGTLFGFG